MSFNYPSYGEYEARIHLDDGTYLTRSSKIEIGIEKIVNPISVLSKEQVETLNKFQMKFSELKGEEKEFVDVRCMIRYLKARDWDLDKSEKMLNNSLNWRKEFKPQSIKAKDISEESRTGKLYTYGKDKYGRPIVYMRPARENSTNSELQLKNLVYFLERTIKTMPNHVEQMVWLIDFKDFSLKNAPPLSQSLAVLNILSDHYPERLGQCFLFDTPFIFNIFWSAVSPFVNSNTKKKIVFIPSNKKEKEKIDILSKTFDMNALEKSIGGKNSHVYNYDEYWKDTFDLETIEEKNLNIFKILNWKTKKELRILKKNKI